MKKARTFVTIFAIVCFFIPTSTSLAQGYWGGSENSSPTLGETLKDEDPLYVLGLSTFMDQWVSGYGSQIWQDFRETNSFKHIILIGHEGFYHERTSGLHIPYHEGYEAKLFRYTALEGAALKNFDLRNIDFRFISLNNVNLDGSILDCQIENCQTDGIQFGNADIRRWKVMTGREDFISVRQIGNAVYIDLTSIHDFLSDHEKKFLKRFDVIVSVDGAGYQKLGHVGMESAYFVWEQGRSYIDAAFQDGPQPSTSYQFSVVPMIPSPTIGIRVWGPYVGFITTEEERSDLPLEVSFQGQTPPAIFDSPDNFGAMISLVNNSERSIYVREITLESRSKVDGEITDVNFISNSEMNFNGSQTFLIAPAKLASFPFGDRLLIPAYSEQLVEVCFDLIDEIADIQGAKTIDFTIFSVSAYSEGEPVDVLVSGEVSDEVMLIREMGGGDING